MRSLKIRPISHICFMIFTLSSYAHEMENKQFWKVYYEHLEKAATHAGM